jgi:succinate-acetate transporter protein
MTWDGSGADRNRIVLRPYANPLPLGFFSFGVGMILLAGLGLGWLSSAQDVRATGVLMATFVFPLELVATVVAVLVRDTAAATALGLYTTSWLGLGLLDVLNPAQQASRPVGLFLVAFVIMLVPLAVSAVFGKRLLAVVLSASIVRAALQACFELGAPRWTETADGIAALVLLALACYSGTAFLVEDLRGGSGLVPRRGHAADALERGADQPVSAEPGVREQL